MAQITNVVGIEVRRRLQDISDIKIESEESVKRSLEAKENADEAKYRSDITKKQLDAAMREGNPIEEVMALAVDPITGEVHDTASDRFEANQRNTIQELMEHTRNISVLAGKTRWTNPVDYKTEENTWAEAFQMAIDDAYLGKCLIPPGVYDIDDTVYVKKSNTHIEFMGYVVINYTGPAGKKVFAIDKNLHNNGSSFVNIKIHGAPRINGGGKASWSFWANGLTERCFVGDLYVTNAVGLFFSGDCWYSDYGVIRAVNNVDGVPEGMTADEWAEIHNTIHSGIVAFKGANSCTINGVRLANLGTTPNNVPSGKTISNQLLYIDGYSVSVEGLSIEGTKDNARKTVVAKNPISFGVGSSYNVRNVYMEKVYTEKMLYLNEYCVASPDLESLYVYNSGFTSQFLIETNYSTSLTIKDLFMHQVQLHPQAQLVRSLSRPSLQLENIEIREGAITIINNKPYSEAPSGNLGVNSVGSHFFIQSGSSIPKILEGLTVEVGSDGLSDFILINPGTIQNHLAQTQRFGYYRHADVSRVGWLIRPPAGAVTYNVCIDINGCVFLENAAAVRSHTARGKIILASFYMSTSRTISNLTMVNNTYKGIFINDASNRKVSLASHPTSGTWSRGDMWESTSPTQGGHIGGVCVVAGSPGVWKNFGPIES